MSRPKSRITLPAWPPLAMIGIVLAPVAHGRTDFPECGPRDPAIGEITLIDARSRFLDLCAFLRDIRRPIRSIQAWGAAPDTAPVNLILRSDRARSFHYSGDSLILTESPAFGYTESLHTWDAATAERVTAHEYGHHLWYERLKKDLPGLREYLSLNTSVIHLTFEEKRVEALPRTADYSFTPENAARMQAIGSALALAQERLKNHPLRPWAIRFVMPASELFADAIAVLHSENLAAIAITGSPVPGEVNPDLIDRDFRIPRDPAVWDNSETHAFFAPVRSHLGQLYTPMPASAEAKRAEVERLYRALLSLLHHHSGSTEWKPAEANVELIRRLPRP